ncbi:hypothetical protein D187_001662 [Cystobacter fuscus DSM 2262]|uniref:Uncharacterized protein n=1 Tax=Cystobacter fuscus (strain ATCC 25194 / DSM 2262 / NBRC 100088 / M29) TaxID=1242864 RepID=S9P9C1_CYSF2|nr:hypothetical protein D187_001662 [Cystobacter fuscus DSM 2262]
MNALQTLDAQRFKLCHESSAPSVRGDWILRKPFQAGTASGCRSA